MDQGQPEAAEVQNLLGQVRAGDRGAFEQLFAKYRAYQHQFVELRLDPKLRARSVSRPGMAAAVTFSNIANVLIQTKAGKLVG